VLALNTLFWRVSGTIVGTAPYATSVAADAPDRLSQATIHLTPSDRIVEPCRKNGGVKKFEELRILSAISVVSRSASLQWSPEVAGAASELHGDARQHPRRHDDWWSPVLGAEPAC
jgi:hypothetical protein